MVAEMFVQMCIKGMFGISRAQAEDILLWDGLSCNWWRERGSSGGKPIEAWEIGKRLTSNNLDLHVNAYGAPHPDHPGRLVRQETPFISLTAGTVSPLLFRRTNNTWSAHQTALDFATDHGRHEGDDCYLFYCWVIVGLRPAVGVKGLAEEVREIKTYRNFSVFQQTEGEIVAKIDVPARQIERFERYEVRGTGRNQQHNQIEVLSNGNYIDPLLDVVNLRGVI
jgi:hypothetical protein